MPFKALPPDTSTLLFKLPHVSNLFVFKENLTNQHNMTRIVTEILRFGQLEMIYMGSAEDRSFNYEDYLQGCEDCAIIRVNLLDRPIFNRDLELARRQFVEELENIDNAITVDSNMISVNRNSSTVDIVIAPVRNSKTQNGRFQAA
ncbi:MAG TPA: hypothetical protein VF676_10180 [Flavobacterium sp.]|jgi:hypothetical protein